MYEEILRMREDEYLRNRFIEKYKPFLAKYTSQVCKRYVSYGVDEELSIALLAFNESIDRYNGEGIFFEYVKLVVRSRLYDYFDSKDYKEKFDKVSLDKEDHQYELNLTSQQHYQDISRQQDLKNEIEELQQLLSAYHIDMIDLYDTRPKHLLSRKHIHQFIAWILQHEDIVSIIIDKGQLPTTLILEQYKTTRKKIEPYRKYIIAVIFICVGQFELLKEYMPKEVIKQ